MRRWWKQLWCLHFWNKDVAVDVEYGRGLLYRYICVRCGKVIKQWSSDGEPVSYVERYMK